MRKRLASNILLLLGVVVLIVLLVEGAAYVILLLSGPMETVSDGPLWAIEQDDDLGYVLPADTAHHAVKRLANGTLCYDATYHYDSLHRRTVFQDYSSDHPAIVLFGCSVTFGEGLEDNGTLAYYLADDLPGVDIYNYAVHGWGPSNALALIEAGRIPKEVPSERVVGLFVIIPAHINRVIGNTDAWWLYDGPYYRMDDGALVREGSFRSGRPFVTGMYDRFRRIKERSRFLTLVNARLPLRFSEDDYVLTAAVLQRAMKAFKETTNGSFYVVFHPEWDEVNVADYGRMRAALMQAGVPLLDYGSLPYRADSKHYCDEHPNAYLNQRLASLLADDTRNLFIT